MANTARDVLRIAAGEVGYSRWNDPQTGTKYGRWYAQKTGDSYYGANGVPYCAMFVSWVFDQAGATCPGLPGAYCPWIERDGKNAGRAVNKYSAQPGDVVLFDWGGDGVADHVGIVEVNHGSYIQTVEGNALPVETPVLTPTGWKAIGELSVGDAVIDPIAGEKSNVKGVFPQGVRPCYEITFSDGRTIVADKNHRWKVKKHNVQKWQVVTTKELFETCGDKWVCEHIQAPVEYEKAAPLIVDPWAVGMAIGDGCLSRSRVAIANSNPQMQEQLIAALGNPNNVYVKDNSKYGYAKGITMEWGKNVTAQFEALGLMGKTWQEKSIPEEYMTASVEDRIALLRGLLDSDGTCDKLGRASFCTGNETLAMQVRDLVFSLGGHCGLYIHHPQYTALSSGEKKRGSLSYRVANINLPFNPFTKVEKADRYKIKNRSKGYGIVSVEKVESRETVCISVTAESELYIAGDWIVTHNTSTGTSGSQGNGGVVARRTRNWNCVKAVIRPTYGSAASTPVSPSFSKPSYDVNKTLDVDGYFGANTVAKLQKALGTPVDGYVSCQPTSNKPYLGACTSTGAWEFTSACGGGSSMIIALQRLIGADPDGWFGPNSIKALQRYLGTTVDGTLSDGGSLCVMELQKRLNAGTFVSGGASSSTPTVSTVTVDVDGWWGPATTKALQKKLGTPVDGIISSQPKSNAKYIVRAGEGWEFVTSGSGSQLIQALQSKIGADADGFFGPNSIKKLQAYLGVSQDGYCGNDTVCALQKAINSGKF